MMEDVDHALLLALFAMGDRTVKQLRAKVERLTILLSVSMQCVQTPLQIKEGLGTLGKEPKGNSRLM